MDCFPNNCLMPLLGGRPVSLRTCQELQNQKSEIIYFCVIHGSLMKSLES